jgi:hypothetical protein
MENCSAVTLIGNDILVDSDIYFRCKEDFP